MIFDPVKPDKRRRRPLSADEHALGSTVTRSVAPLRRVDAGRQAPSDRDTPAPKAPFDRTASAPAARPTRDAVAAKPPLAPLDRRLKQRLVRGSETIDARIDLHGLT